MHNTLLNTLGRITLLITFNLSLLACGGSSGDTPADTTAPTISSTTPAASATSVARNSVVSATFDEDIFATTVDAASFTLAKSGSVDGAVSFDGVTNVATFTPSNELAVLANYTVTLSTAITDLSGNPLATDYNWSFTTAEGAWSTAALITDDNTAGHDAFTPQIGLDANGNAMAVWTQSDGSVVSVWANRYNAGTSTWGTAVVIESDDAAGHDAFTPQIGLDANGNAMAVWTQSVGSLVSVWANRYNAGTGIWGTAVVIESDDAAGHDASDPQIGLDASGNAMAVWQQFEGSINRAWANRYNAGTGTWGTPMELETAYTGNASLPQIEFDASGNGVAVWAESDGSVFSIWANRFK